MQPERFEIVGGFLAIKWKDGEETVVSLEVLRRACPCARCSGESDLYGDVRHVGPPVQLRPESFRVLRWERVGNYAVQPTWADGHDTGIYSWAQLRDLGDAADEEE